MKRRPSRCAIVRGSPAVRAVDAGVGQAGRGGRGLRAPRAADRHDRHLIRRPRSATLEPPAMRRRFSFALLLVLDVGIRQPIAGPGSAGRAPRSAIRRPPDVARGPCLSGHSAVIQTPEIAARGHGRRALWPTAWAMFQTNNTSVFPTGPNCPIIPRKVAYIFVRGPYDQTRRPVGRGA
jgi:hypothetical protein